MKDENGNLLADSHDIFKRWRNYFCQLLNVHSVNDTRETETHTVPEPSCFEVETASENLKDKNHQVLIKFRYS